MHGLTLIPVGPFWQPFFCGMLDFMAEANEILYAALKPALERVEQVRLEKLASLERRKKIAWPVGAVISLVCGRIDWFLLMAFKDSDDGFVGVTVFALGLLYGWVTQPRREYIKQYKQDIMPRIAKAAADLVYDVKGTLSMDTIKPSKIVPSYDKAVCEDGFTGCYKGTDINFCELKLTETQGSGKNRRTVTKFKGLVILLEMNRKFLGHTILVRDQNSIGSWFTEKTSKMMRADLVDPAFEKLYNVYTTDQVEARYLIDPVMMEKLTDMKNHYKGENITAAYFNSQMLIMISSAYNFFEPPDIYKPAIDMEAVKMLRDEVEQIVSIIDYLEIHDPRQKVA